MFPQELLGHLVGVFREGQAVQVYFVLPLFVFLPVAFVEQCDHRRFVLDHEVQRHVVLLENHLVALTHDYIIVSMEC